MGESLEVPSQDKILSDRMNLVRQIHKQARQKLSEEVVHDLRVSIRRCRSIADAISEVDDDPSWLAMKKAGKRVFKRLGGVRDLHVMEGWVRHLAPEGDALADQLQKTLKKEEESLLRRADKAVRRFDRKQWKLWTKALPKRLRREALDLPVFEHLALRRWQEAFEQHHRAVLENTQDQWHQLRIAVKRLRYVVENFLPQRQVEWGKDLHHLQDLLGEVHDLDVLWGRLCSLGDDFSPEERKAWSEIIDRERSNRLEEYKRLTAGEHSLWQKWRQGLPDGEDLEQASLACLKAWASCRDHKIDRAENVCALSLQLFNALVSRDSLSGKAVRHGHRLVQAAAWMHRLAGDPPQPERAGDVLEDIRSLRPPIGWTAQHLERLIEILERLWGVEFQADTGQEADSSHEIPSQAIAEIIRMAQMLNHLSTRDFPEVRPESAGNGELVISLSNGSKKPKTEVIHECADRLSELLDRQVKVETTADGS